MVLCGVGVMWWCCGDVVWCDVLGSVVVWCCGGVVLVVDGVVVVVLSGVVVVV